MDMSKLKIKTMLKKIILICFLSFTFIEGQAQDSPQLSSIFIDDKDGQEYKTVVIGKYVILAENYNYEFEDNVSSFQCDNLNSNEDRKQFGRYYTHQAAKRLAPKGWRLPTLDDWDEINKFIKLKNGINHPKADVSKLLNKGSTGINLKMMGSHPIKTTDGIPNKSKPICGKQITAHYWLDGTGEGTTHSPEGTYNYLLLWEGYEGRKDSTLYNYGNGAPFDRWAFPVRYIKDL